jgi:hypothetical protein
MQTAQTISPWDWDPPLGETPAFFSASLAALGEPRLHWARRWLVAVIAAIALIAVVLPAGTASAASYAWTQLNPSPAPPARARHALAYDAARDRNVFIYVLEGAGSLEIEGKPAVTQQAGSIFHEPPKQVQISKNTSQTAPVK